MQDTKQVLAKLREANFAAEEQRDKLLRVQTELEGKQQQLQAAQQTMTELQAELQAQAKQQQHLLDELSHSQVVPHPAAQALPCHLNISAHPVTYSMAMCNFARHDDTNWLHCLHPITLFNSCVLCDCLNLVCDLTYAGSHAYNGILQAALLWSAQDCSSAYFVAIDCCATTVSAASCAVNGVASYPVLTFSMSCAGGVSSAGAAAEQRA